MIRKATRVDVPRIMEIRAAVRENKLRDPSRVTVEDVHKTELTTTKGGLFSRTRAVHIKLRQVWALGGDVKNDILGGGRRVEPSL